MPDIVRVNQTLYSWNSCVFKIDNQPWEGIVETNWEQTRERKIVYAARRNGVALGFTSGKYAVKAFTVKMLRDSADAFTDQLSDQYGSYGDTQFGFMTQVIEPVPGAIPLTATSPITLVVGKKDAQAEGVDELVTEFELASIYMIENGKTLWSGIRSLT